MIFLAKLGVGVLGTALVAGAAVSSEGFIQVRVHEKQPGGTNINLIVPAALATTALHFVPKHHLEHAPADLRQCLPIIDAAVPALRQAPDGVLVEVEDSGEHVVITKTGASVTVDVNDSGDIVHVSVPLRALQNAVHQIAEATPEN